MDDVQSWPEVPSIAHFCSLFRAAFNLLDFDIEELEEALLTDGAEDSGSSLLQELIVRLLCGCIQNNDISTFNYQMYLRRLFRQKCQEYGRENPFNTDIDFQFLPLRVKVEILHALCDFRLDAPDVPDLLRNLESDSLRVEPLGHDENKSAYWYFYGTRLYREDFPKLKKKIKERKKRRKENKRRRRNSSESDLDIEEPGAGVWQVVCFTEADWVSLAAKLKGSSCKDEREMYNTLVEDFLPEIPRLFAEKERQQRRRMMDYQPRRQSTRLEKLKQKEMRDVMPQLDDESDKAKMERERRLSMRNENHSSESGWDDSADSGDADEEAFEPKNVAAFGRPAGRQTNNSLSSATGQIIIQPPKRKKLRSKQVFKTNVEDLQTGMYKILEYVRSQEDSWPFVSPVDENYAPRYYSVIRRPMDLRRMEEKLDSGEYLDLNHFRDDFQLIVDNCRQYNGSENEYTEMVNNLLEAFNDAVDRFLESDPSSDDEIADFGTKGKVDPVRQREKRNSERKDSGSGWKRSKVKRRRKDKEASDSASGSEFDEPPALKPQRDRSSGSDRSGSVPGSDFDEHEPDFLRETSPPTLEREESESDGPPLRPKRLAKNRGRRANAESDSDSADMPIRRPGRGRLRRGGATSDSEGQHWSRKGKGSKRHRSGSDSDSQPPSRTDKSKQKRTLGDSDSESLSRPLRMRHNKNFDIEALVSVSEEALKSMTSMLEDCPLKSGFSSASNSPIHMTEDFSAEPLRPPLKTERHFRNPRDPTRRRKPLDLLRPVKRKDIRTIDRLQPGKSKGNLIGNLPKPKDPSEENSVSIGLGLAKSMKESRNALLVKTDEAGPKLSLGTVLKSDVIDFGKSKHNFDALLAEDRDEKNEMEVVEKLDVLAEESHPTTRLTQPSKLEDTIDDKEEDTITNKENDPKVEKPKDIVSPGDAEEKKRDAVKEITNKATPNASAWFKAFGAPKAPSNIKKKQEVTETPPIVEEKESTWGSTSIPAGGGRRQRKASSSSSVSEPSSLSQDSPLHPVSPGLVSPRGEPPPPPMNGTLRVGFYQDMSSVHKSSPEKQSPRSTHSSPRDLNNPSPFQSYSHVYPPSSPGVYSSYTSSTPAPPPQQSQVMSPAPSPSPQPQPPSPSPIPTSIYDNMHQYTAYTEPYRQPVRTIDNYNYKPSEPVAKPNPSIFPVKKRLYASVEASRSMEMPKEAQPPQNDLLVGRDMYKESVDRYSMDVAFQQRSIGPYGNSTGGKSLEVSRLHQSESDPMVTSRLPPSQPDLSRLSMGSDMGRAPTHPEVMAMSLGDKPKYHGPERSLNAMIEGLGRMPSPGRGFPSSLERLMQPPSIQEDSDGVFRNKFPVDAAYQSQRHPTPVSSAYPSHMVDRYDEERLGLSNPYYDKNLYLKNVATTSSLPLYQDPNPPNPQPGYELNIPKARDPKANVKRKKSIKGQEAGGSTAFQQYVGLKTNEPSVLKPTAPVPGSAFNFGPGLNGPLYSEGYLEDLRQPGAFYGMVGAPPARSSTYPLPQYMGHQPALVDGYQQYLQRVQEEQFRHSLAYPPGYHPALGMRQTYDRPSWL